MAVQTLQVYLPKDLWEKVQAAEAMPASNFKATEFCKNQLTALFEQGVVPEVGDAPPTQPQQPWVPSRQQAQDFNAQLDRALANDFNPLTEVDYDIHYEDTVTSGMSYLTGVVQPAGARPISVWTDVAGRMGFLVAWPRQ